MTQKQRWLFLSAVLLLSALLYACGGAKQTVPEENTLHSEAETTVTASAETETAPETENGGEAE